MARMTATSYVVLALLARRPYSAYELTNEIKRAMNQCMPRSSTLLYREPKNLVGLGYAVVDVQAKGLQKKAVYSITPAGRSALDHWFKRPATPPVFESEAVVRLTFGHLGTREDLVACLAAMETQVGELVESNVTATAGWFERFPPPGEHLADLALLSKLYLDFYALLVDWSRWAREQIAARPEEWTDEDTAQLTTTLQSLLDQARGLVCAADSTRADPTRAAPPE